MNGYSPERGPYSYAGQRNSPSRGRAPTNGRPPADGFRKDVMNAYQASPRYSPMSPNRPQNSSLVDLDDPIQVHLLTETALSDSTAFEILSPEEIDDLKRECQTLTQRIEQTRANLSLQIKYRDAAASMAKLYLPGGKRKSLLGNRGNGSESASAREVVLEKETCERRCEELSNAIANLEKRLIDSRRRVLEHTAGVLQLTHKASKRPPPQSNGLVPNGMPGSPESLYAYSNDRNSLDMPLDDVLVVDDVAFIDRPSARAIEIPVKSPVRQQTLQLREETGRLQDENGQLRNEAQKLREEVQRLKGEADQLRAQTDAFGLESGALRRENDLQQRSLSDAEQRLASVNTSLRDVIVRFNPTTSGSFKEPPPPASSTGAEPVEAVAQHFDYLQQVLLAIRREQDARESEGARAAEAAASSTAEMTRAEGRIEDINSQIRDILSSVNAPLPLPTNPSGSRVQDQLAYLQEGLSTVETSLSSAFSAASAAEQQLRAETEAAAARSQATEETNVALRSMWNAIQSNYETLKRRKEERRATRSVEGGADDDDEMSGDDFGNPDEEYSVATLSSRIRSISNRVTNLSEQKSVLKRQIKQQRELNSKSEVEARLRSKDEQIEARDAELQTRRSEVQAKDTELGQMREENTELKGILERAQADAQQTQGMLLAALRDLDVANKNKEATESAALRAALEELEEKRTKLQALETSSQDLESRLNMTEASRQDLQVRMTGIDEKIEALEVELVEARATRKAAEMASEYKQKELDAKQKELKEKDDIAESMNLMVVELKTELTIARAELDGAYGSRAERAADAAAIRDTDETTRLRGELENLKTELAQTLKQLEDITRETIDAEREKLEIEGRLDDAEAARSSLEAETKELRERLDKEMLASREKISQLQDDLDGARLKVNTGGEGAAKPGAGASMLSEQFRATMREERKKFQEDLRAEQARRRKVEDELAQLKKAQGPGKSPLSPR